MSGDGGTSVVAQSESTSSRGLWVLTETGLQEDKGGVAVVETESTAGCPYRSC